MITRALISVSDKTGLIPFAQFLAGAGVELLSTGGTAEALRAAGIPVRDVSEVTQFPEMMDGRVKTLHPVVHGGLLARRDTPSHMASAAAHSIGMIDLLVVNLYPFETTLNRTNEVAELIENIDIGGPAMIRSAAKNHASVTVIVDVADYARVMQSMQENKNAVAAPLRTQLAAKAFARTAAYDTLIASWLTSAATDSPWPPYLLDASLATTLRYGENPHQAAALYQRLDAKGGIANAQQLQGKELSYNNLADAEAAWAIAMDCAAAFSSCVASHGEPLAEGVSGKAAKGVIPPSIKNCIAVLIKHANPCGVATGATLVDAFTDALASDPVSAFGGILAVNQPVDAALVEAIGSLFLEVIIAPEFTAEARAALAAKKNLRLLVAAAETHASPLSHWVIQAISGGYLVQQSDRAPHAPEQWKTVTGGALGDAVLADAALAWTVVKHVKSNAIVLVKNGATIGVGAGQMSRVDSVRIAIEKARAHGHDPRGAVLASDAFFPFADNVELAAEAGIATVIQPGGSVRDAEVITAAEKHGIAMLFTGTRHFRH